MPSPAPAVTFDEVNALVETYYETLGAAGYASPLPLDPADTVLLLVDVQQHLTTRALRASLKAVGVYTAEAEPVLEAIDQDLQAALQNIRLVLQACRENGIRPIHVGIQSLLPEAEDTGALHKAGGLLYPPGSLDSAFLPEATPVDGEIVLTKTCSGAHVGTHLDQVLRNLGVQRILVAGFYTDQCISTSVRDLADIGYQVSLVEDAMGAMSPQRHQHALESIRKLYANSETTSELLPRLETITAARARKKGLGWLPGRHRN